MIGDAPLLNGKAEPKCHRRCRFTKGRFTSVLDKDGFGGVIIAALSCAACFPGLGALASTVGVGFLSLFEGVEINKLLPLFAFFSRL